MFTTRPELLGTFGMVASTHWLASAAGMAMLEAGGNAFDAAVAAGFTLQIVEPHLNGPGGDVPIIFHAAETGDTKVLCGQGPSPQAATIERLTEMGYNRVPGGGLLPAVVPGAFDAWLTMMRDHGTMDLPTVLAPAIHYASGGFPVLPSIADAIRRVEKLFSDEWTTSGDTWFRNGSAPANHSLFQLPTLAQTYARLAACAEGKSREAGIEAARNEWREGFVAEAIDKFCRTHETIDVTGNRPTGLLTGDDMARWQASYEDPLTLDYRGMTVCKTGPWGQGPIFLQQLAILKGFDLDRMDPLGPDFVHVVTEACKLAMADREAYYGDPDFVDVPIETLLSDSYAAERRALIGDTASLELQPGQPDGRTPALADPIPSSETERRLASLFGMGEPTQIDEDAEIKGDTCHVDVVDRWGNMVSATPSGGWLQSSPCIPELGFCLGSRGQMFWLQPGLPTSLAPGRRPRTTLTPTLVLRDGKPILALGTPGGDQQDQWSLTMFARWANHDLNLQQTIDMPMFHNDHAPSSFWPREAQPGVLAVEGRFDMSTLTELDARGHRLHHRDDWSLGRLSAVEREETANGVVLKAGANPRQMQGYAVGR
ncbi:MAG: gamma-glutamyltransferase family protein [Pseudomonadota bacterium]